MSLLSSQSQKNKMEKSEQVLGAFVLWKDNLITDEVFHATLSKIKGNPVKVVSTSITPGQVGYIKKLIGEGKLPQNQTLELTKTEAQVLIHNAVESVKSAESAKVEEKLTEEEKKSLYDEENCYF